MSKLKLNSTGSTNLGNYTLYTQILRDKHRNQIGEIKTDNRGVHVAYDRYRNRIGEYDPKSNITCDKYHNDIGTGNLLASLVVQHLQKSKPTTAEIKSNVKLEDPMEEVSPIISSRELIGSWFASLLLVGVSFLAKTFAKHESNSNFSEHPGYGVLYCLGWFFLVCFAVTLIWFTLKLMVRFVFWTPVFRIWFLSATIYMLYKIGFLSGSWQWLQSKF